jgi:hypothetical protein
VVPASTSPATSTGSAAKTVTTVAATTALVPAMLCRLNGLDSR